MSFRATIAAIALSLAVACGDTAGPQPTDPDGPTQTHTGGKADEFSAPTTYEGTCAADAPSVPYQPVPTGTRAQPDGPEVLRTRVGVPFEVDYSHPTPLVGKFTSGDCGRHYFVFTLDRAARLVIDGGAFSGGEPAPLSLCFSRPRFLRIDTPWYADIWQKDVNSEPMPPCGQFVPVADHLESADGIPLELAPGAYELTIDPETTGVEYELDFDFEPIGSAVCGDGVREPGEACDDGNQMPLDWCGTDCRPQRLDIEPIPNNESTATAQPLDGFRVLNFYAPPGDKEVDVYSLELYAGESVVLHRGERICQDTFVQMFGSDGVPLGEPWDCADMEQMNQFTATYDGTHYLRFETAPDGARSVSAEILP